MIRDYSHSHRVHVVPLASSVLYPDKLDAQTAPQEDIKMELVNLIVQTVLLVDSQ